jgi:hypothetical protein
MVTNSISLLAKKYLWFLTKEKRYRIKTRNSRIKIFQTIRILHFHWQFFYAGKVSEIKCLFGENFCFLNRYFHGKFKPSIVKGLIATFSIEETNSAEYIS